MEGEFYEHLDKCAQCRNHPFNLCPIGSKALQETAEKAMDNMTFNFLAPFRRK